jgi:putative ABC transport system permease protein
VTGVIQDLRYALRLLSKNPGFTAVDVLRLALVIGATTVISTVVSGVLLKPLAYPQPESLVTLFVPNRQTEGSMGVMVQYWGQSS